MTLIFQYYLFDQQSPPLTWVSKILNWSFFDPILLSTYFSCSAYMQNFKNIISTLWLPLSWLFLVYSYSSVPMCLILHSDLYDVLIYVMPLFTKFLHLLSLLYYLSPLLNFILKMNEWGEVKECNQNDQNLSKWQNLVNIPF